MPWIQVYAPVGGSIGKSAAVAAVPLAVVFVLLAVFRLKAHQATLLARDIDLDRVARVIGVKLDQPAEPEGPPSTQPNWPGW